MFNKIQQVLNGIRPPRPDWYEELYALALDKLMKPYETEIAGYKSPLFANLKGNAESILEIGVGTGPNLKYYADYPGVNVFGVDPNRKMEKYAQAASEKAGIKPSNFMFMQGVAEALPLDDASVDAVVGTLVLCSVNDVDRALQEIMRVLKPGGIYIFVEHVVAKDGTTLRFVQRILDPLQQTVADGCHLTRNTTDNIAPLLPPQPACFMPKAIRSLSSPSHIYSPEKLILIPLRREMYVHCSSVSLDFAKAPDHDPSDRFWCERLLSHRPPGAPVGSSRVGTCPTPGFLSAATCSTRRVWTKLPPSPIETPLPPCPRLDES